jgi:heme exporter protein C
MPGSPPTILLFLYLGVIALYNAFSDKVVAGRAAGILALVGVINLPIIHYSVEWWNTLQGPPSPSLTNPPSPRCCGRCSS